MMLEKFNSILEHKSGMVDADMRYDGNTVFFHV